MFSLVNLPIEYWCSFPALFVQVDETVSLCITGEPLESVLFPDQLGQVLSVLPGNVPLCPLGLGQSLSYEAASMSPGPLGQTKLNTFA